MKFYIFDRNNNNDYNWNDVDADARDKVEKLAHYDRYYIYSSKLKNKKTRL